jgi:curved DNA-binding protein CbpA
VDHYEALGVPADAGGSEIRRAYLENARRHHPDFHVGATESERAGHAARMKAVTEAWHVLGDATRRAAYDAARSGRGSGSGAAPDVDVPAGKGWTPRPGDDAWIDDFGSWAADVDDLADDEIEVADGRRRVGGVVAVALFAASIFVGFMGMVFESRGMLAAAAGGVVVSSVLFVFLPLIEMTRHRSRPTTTR